MIEYIVVLAIILGAAVWFLRWLLSTAKGKGGCSCGTGTCCRERAGVAEDGCGCDGAEPHRHA